MEIKINNISTEIKEEIKYKDLKSATAYIVVNKDDNFKRIIFVADREIVFFDAYGVSYLKSGSEVYFDTNYKVIGKVKESLKIEADYKEAEATKND